jgi:NADPH:quinone reductase-like Zn-dependent oxidoreductase
MPRILLCEKVDGRSELVLKDVEAPQPGPGEVRYRVHAVGLNRADILYVRGVHFFPTKFPSRVCVEASGVVDAVGAGVTEFQIGDCVTALPVLDETFGVGGEFAITPADCLAPWPAGFSAAEACSIWMQYLTAYFPLKEMTPVGPGDAILVTAASGSAGLGGVQLAKLFGATVIATTRTERKRQFLLNAGADHVVVTERGDVAAQILSCTQNKGVGVVYDAVAGRFINEYASGLAQDAQIIVYGVMGGREY